MRHFSLNQHDGPTDGPKAEKSLVYATSGETLRSTGMQESTMEETLYPLEEPEPSGNHQITQPRDVAHTYESNTAPFMSTAVLSSRIPISHQTTMC